MNYSRLLIIFSIIISMVLSTTMKDTHLALAEMRKTPFGATILSTIQLNISAGYDVNPIIELVQEIISRLKQDQDEADSRNNLNQGRCDLNIASFNRQIQDTTNAITNLQSSIEINQNNLANDQIRLQSTSTDYDNTLASIANGSIERQNGEQRWRSQDGEIKEGIEQIDEVTRLIQHITHGVSFAQVQTRYDKVVNILENNKSKHSTLFKPLILALQSLSSTIDNPKNNKSEALIKILNILSNLRSALTQTQADNYASEKSAVIIWNQLLEQLQNNKSRYAEEKSKLNNHIKYTQDLINSQIIQLENNRNAQENFQIQLHDEQILCDKQIKEYSDQTKENEREINILKELNEHLTEKFQQVVEFIQ